MKKVAVIQSNYIPWKGYFDIIHDVDLFVFYDDVQYSKNDWRNRNKILTAQGATWLTIPVGSYQGELICEIELTNTLWAKKHWKSIKQSYSKAPYFKTYEGFFERAYLETEWNNLSVLNHFLIKSIATEFLGIDVEFKDSREFDPVGNKLDRLLDLLQKVEAGLYVSGPTARDYIDEKRFEDAGIDLVFKDYLGYPEYPQRYQPFDHYVTVLDLLFNCGPEAPYYIWGWRNETRLS